MIGVDIEASAIEDAKRNAAANGITNCEFICSPAEKVMADLLRNDVTKGGGGGGMTSRLRPRGDDCGSPAKWASREHRVGVSEMQRYHRADLCVLQPDRIVRREHV